MKAFASGVTLAAAKEVVQHNKIVNQGDDFEVYEVPAGLSTFRGYALLLFRETHDFGEGKAPKGTMIIPINIDNRRGYFIDRNIARSYS